MSLKSRIEKAESKVLSFNTGVPKWALDVAESHAHSEKFRIESLRRLHRAIEESTGKKQPKPRPPEFQTDVEKKQHALELYQKYQTYENYMKNHEPKNIKVSDNLKRVIKSVQ